MNTQNPNIRTSIIFAKLTLSVALLLLATAYISPRHLAIRCTINIKADSRIVLATIANPESFINWNPWSKYDTAVVFRTSRNSFGIIDRISWSSPNNHELFGSLLYLKSKSENQQEIIADFGRQGNGHFIFHSVSINPQNTLLILEFKTDFGMNPMTRLYGITARWWMEDDLELALERIKSLSEQRIKNSSPNQISPMLNSDLDVLAINCH